MARDNRKESPDEQEDEEEEEGEVDLEREFINALKDLKVKE